MRGKGRRGREEGGGEGEGVLQGRREKRMRMIG